MAKAKFERVKAANLEKRREILALRLQAAWRGRDGRNIGLKWMRTVRLAERREYFIKREGEKNAESSVWRLAQALKKPANVVIAQTVDIHSLAMRKKRWRDNVLPCVVSMIRGCPTAWTSSDVTHLLEEGDRVLIDVRIAPKRGLFSRAAAGGGVGGASDGEGGDGMMWREEWDEASQSPFYVNGMGETVWERPAEMDSDIVEAEKAARKAAARAEKLLAAVDAELEAEEAGLLGASDAEEEDEIAGNDVLQKMREAKMSLKERAASKRARRAARKRAAKRRKQKERKRIEEIEANNPEPGEGRVFFIKATPDNVLNAGQIPLHKGWPEEGVVGCHIYKLPPMPAKELLLEKASKFIGQGVIGQSVQKARRKVGKVLKDRTLALAEFALKEKVPKGEVSEEKKKKMGELDGSDEEGSAGAGSDEEAANKEESEESDPELLALEQEEKRIAAEKAERKRKPNKLKVFAAAQLRKVAERVFEREEVRANAGILKTAGESNAGWRMEKQADGSKIWYNDATGVISYETPKFILHKRAMAAAREAEIEADKQRALDAEKAEQERERLAMKKKMEARRRR